MAKSPQPAVMPRQVRIEFPGATYHVMCRGNRREAIFEDDRDRKCFVDTLAQASKRAGWLVHAYVLMGNHYHILVETPQANQVPDHLHRALQHEASDKRAPLRRAL